MKTLYKLSLKLGLALFALGLSALAANEIMMHLLSHQDRYYVWPPHMRKVFKPGPTVFPGIQGPTRFETNSVGIRGSELNEKQDYRILAIGGSTTECLYLDQSKAWPQLLEQKLNLLKQGGIWVGNAGKSGMTSRDHIMQTKYLLPELPKIDTVVMLIGINDFMLGTCDEHYDSNFLKTAQGEKEQIAHAFSICPVNRYQPLSKSIGLVRVIRELRMLVNHEAVRQDASGEIYVRLRHARQTASEYVDWLPPLKASLAEYRDNLTQIIHIVRQHSMRLIFMTQPSLWGPNMTAQDTALLWKGRIGGDELLLSQLKPAAYYSIPALIKGMKAYNDMMLEVCRMQQVECIDLANKIPKNSRFFYDDVHFNEEGAAKVATIVYDYLKTTTAVFKQAKL